MENLRKVMSRYPSKKMIWLPNLTITSSRFVYRFLFFLCHYVPAFLVDIVLVLKGSDIRLTKIYSKVYYYFQLYSYFNDNHWTFADQNMQKIYATLNKRDLQDFPCFASADHYEQHYLNTVNGIRKYFFKETDEDLVEARLKYQKLTILRYIVLGLIYGSLAYCLCPRLLKLITAFFETYNVRSFN